MADRAESMFKGVRNVPRPYQSRAQDAVYAHWDSDAKTGAMLVMATGSGKTRTAMSIAMDCVEAGDRVAWLGHRRELLDQPYNVLAEAWPHCIGIAGIVQANRDASDARIVFASVDTLRNEKRMTALLAHGAFDVVIVDEAHHSTSPTHRKCIDALCDEHTALLGLTATADRTDGADLGEQWEIVFSYGIVSAIRENWLVPPFAVVDRLKNLDLSKVGGRRDYDDGELGRELLIAGIVDHTVAAMMKTHLCEELPHRSRQKMMSAKGRKSIVFTATVEQAKLTSEALTAAGMIARYVHGETPKADRTRLIRAFELGKIDVICNAAILTEGTDLPICDVIVMARPTKSWSLFVQCVGRGLRLYKGKTECLLLDLAGASADHSLISAPVLMGGSKCPKSPNAIHDYQQMKDDVRGICIHCSAKVSCFIALEETGEGSHRWDDDIDPEKRRCKYCKRAQCESAIDGRHHFIPFEDFQRICIDCDLKIPDPHSSMVGRRVAADTVEADWFRVPGVAPETYAVDVGEHGILFVLGNRAAAEWRPYWLPKSCRKARPLSDGPIPAAEVRGYANDLVSRAKRFEGLGQPTWKQKTAADYRNVDLSMCGTKAEAAKELARDHARNRAIKTGIAQPIPGWGSR